MYDQFELLYFINMVEYIWIYKTYKYFLKVETYDILMATHNFIWFKIMIKEFDTLFDHTLQEGEELNTFNINIIKSEHVINIYQKDHIIKNSIQ